VDGDGGIVSKKGKSQFPEISISITTNCTNCASYHIIHVRGLVRLMPLLTSSSQGRISSTSNPFPSRSSSSRSSSSFSLASINRSLSSCAELSFLLLRSLWSASSSSSSEGKDGEFGFEEGTGEDEEGRPGRARGLFMVVVMLVVVVVVVVVVTGSSSKNSGRDGGKDGGGKKSSESSTMFNLEKYRSGFSARGSHQSPDSSGGFSSIVRVDGMVSGDNRTFCSKLARLYDRLYSSSTSHTA
jgi:hypothetical protein